MEEDLLSKRFIHFSIKECKDSCKLYEYLSLKIAEDAELLNLCSYAQAGQPIPNLLFGAVHYLLLKGKQHQLRDYYPSLTERPKHHMNAYPYFKEFCLANREEIIRILETKLVQTNEVRRCAYLYPVFCFIYEKVKKPLALIEIGTSAGLQLMWDEYSYSYGDGKRYGHLASKVHITSDIRSGIKPKLLPTSPPVYDRCGIDLHVNLLKDDEDYLWLKALIWPSHHERRILFDLAADHIKSSRVKLIEGDGIELLPDLASQISDEAVLCIFHTHVANQIPFEGKIKLLETIKNIGLKRDVFHLYNNIQDGDLHLDYFLNGQEYQNTIGKTDGHGRWFEWKLDVN